MGLTWASFLPVGELNASGLVLRASGHPTWIQLRERQTAGCVSKCTGHRRLKLNIEYCDMPCCHMPHQLRSSKVLREPGKLGICICISVRARSGYRVQCI